MTISIKIKPRIHVNLISMHKDGYRMNGGVGFSIADPIGYLNFIASRDFSLSDNRKYSLSKNEIIIISNIINDIKARLQFKHNIEVEINGGMLTHFGMGAGTAIRLACLEALHIINGKEVLESEIIKYSMRGGTSGIGIRTYFKGGLAFDLGAQKSDFKPSSHVYPDELPMLLDTSPIPEWKIGICIGNRIKPKTQTEEVAFFQKACPISPEESYKSLYHSLFGVYASVRTADLFSFTSAIKEIQKCEWKMKERAQYGNDLVKIENQLYNLGALCVGMSSLGPLLFFMARDDDYIKIKEKMEQGKHKTIITSCSNQGREILC